MPSDHLLAGGIRNILRGLELRLAKAVCQMRATATSPARTPPTGMAGGGIGTPDGGGEGGLEAEVLLLGLIHLRLEGLERLIRRLRRASRAGGCHRGELGLLPREDLGRAEALLEVRDFRLAARRDEDKWSGFGFGFGLNERDVREVVTPKRVDF
jgi:hypothetical protein